MVGGMEKGNRPCTHTCQLSTRRDSDYRGPPKGAKDLNLIQRLPSPGFSYQEEEFPQNLTVKISGDSDHLGEKKGP